MINPLAIAWKHNYAEGIATYDGELIAWPEGLGPWPTASDLLGWEKEYNAFLAKPTPIESLLAKPDSDWSIDDIKVAVRFIITKDKGE